MIAKKSWPGLGEGLSRAQVVPGPSPDDGSNRAASRCCLVRSTQFPVSPSSPFNVPPPRPSTLPPSPSFPSLSAPSFPVSFPFIHPYQPRLASATGGRRILRLRPPSAAGSAQDPQPLPQGSPRLLQFTFARALISSARSTRRRTARRLRGGCCLR